MDLGAIKQALDDESGALGDARWGLDDDPAWSRIMDDLTEMVAALEQRDALLRTVKRALDVMVGGGCDRGRMNALRAEINEVLGSDEEGS